MTNTKERGLIDLSHTIEHGMITYKGVPAPLICVIWPASRMSTIGPTADSTAPCSSSLQAATGSAHGAT